MKVLYKILVVILLGVFVFEGGGLIFGWQMRLWIHKISMSLLTDNGSKLSNVITITMTPEQFDVVKIHYREFKLNGNMYDIVWRESVGDSIRFFCYHDTDEEKMVVKFIGNVANSTTDNNANNRLILRSIPLGINLYPPEHVKMVFTLEKISTFFSRAIFAPLQCTNTIDPPPPRFHL